MFQFIIVIYLNNIVLYANNTSKFIFIKDIVKSGNYTVINGKGYTHKRCIPFYYSLYGIITETENILSL